MKPARFAHLATVVLLAAGCGRTSRVTSPAPVVYGDPADIVTTLTASAPEFTPGNGTLHVHVHSVNPTARPIRITYNGCMQTFVLRDGTRELGGPMQACPASLFPATLEPDQALDWSFDWDGALASSSGQVTLVPGDYQLVGILRVDGPPPSAPVPLRILAP